MHGAPGMEWIRAVVRDRVPGAVRINRRVLNWVYSRPSARRELFDSIASQNAWGGSESVSGVGSDLAQTEALRRELPRVWDELGIRRLADVPCGDFVWMSEIAGQLDFYFGGDIAPRVVEAASRHARPGRIFARFDLLTDEFPEVDAILARDVLVHLSNSGAQEALRNICRSSAKYLLTTTFTEKPSADIVTGSWRPLNLEAPPISLPPPLLLINEECTVPGDYADKCLGIWSIERLREHVRPG